MEELTLDLVQVGGGALDVLQKGEVRALHVKDFSIGRAPVTQALWEEIMGTGNNPAYFQGKEQPVENVDLDQVAEFLSRLSRRLHAQLRLPTTAEWLFAATGGTHSEGYDFAGSDKAIEIGWTKKNSHAMTQPARLKLPNELGLYDMTGNVHELTVTSAGDETIYPLCGGSFEQDEQVLKLRATSEGPVLWPRYVFQQPTLDVGFRVAMSH